MSSIRSAVGPSQMGVLMCTLAVAGLSAAGTDPRLVEAAKLQDKAAIRALLAQNVDVRSSDPSGATALHWAAHWNDLETADLLIRAGANVNAATDNGVTPISEAATNASMAMAAILLKADADANALTATGETVLMTAARTGNANI